MSRKKSRLYVRNQGGVTRYYADFRDLGGGREALVPKGETRATTDLVVAEALVANRLKDFQASTRDRVLLGIKRRAGLEEYAAEHLEKKAKSGRVADSTLAQYEQQLRTAVEFFGAERDVSSITVSDIHEFVAFLASRPSGRKRGDGTTPTLSPGAQRRYLAALSHLFSRAQGEELVPPGYNPVAAMLDKPIGRPKESPWLETWEMALLLEAARTFPFEMPDDSSAAKRLKLAIGAALGLGGSAEAEFVRRIQARGMLPHPEVLDLYLSGKRIPTRRFLEVAAEVLGLPADSLHRPRGSVGDKPDRQSYVIMATWALTGARETEAYGLHLGDVDVRHRKITFRDNAHRALKTRTSFRTVPYWDQLQGILEPHIEERRKQGAKKEDLVFVSARTGKMVNDMRRSLDAFAQRAGWNPGEIRSRMFRHTYTAARLQTLDRGAPVSIYTVARELGHGGDSLVRRVYGHLGELRHRSEAVEYRIEELRDEVPAERLRLLLKVM